MRSVRPDLVRTLVLVALLVGSGGCARERGGLVVATSNDLQGKTSPCGCHTPKGGLARRATFVDSLRAAGREVLLLDAGGFFPVTDDERDAGPFVLEALGRQGTAAAGVGPNELRFGYSFVRERARDAGVALLCANLVRFETGEPAFEGWRTFERAGVRVGVFGLMSETADMGPARDSLRVDPVEPAARRAVEALRADGAQVVVLLSQLGRAQGESLAVRVSGIDLVVGGGGVPHLDDGVRVGDAKAVYGGHQGWYMGVTEVRSAGSGRADLAVRTHMLGPGVRDQRATAAAVKVFEDSLNARMRRRDAELAAGARPGERPEHYVGMSNCVRCHKQEYAQWATTAHARAWKTLVDLQKESTPACVGCHVTGYRQPGGFRTAEDAARLANVQCESCHGMGTDHRDWQDNGNTVPEAVCRTCHTPTTSPGFTMAAYRPHVLHDPPANLRPLPESPAKKLMREGADPHGK